MKKALGLVEIKGLATAIVVADTMAKTANITITQVENTKGLGWMTVKVTGDVGAVTAAVNAGKQMGILNGDFVTAKILPRPSDFVETYFCQTETKEKSAEKVVTNKKKKEKTNTEVLDNNKELDTEIQKEVEKVEEEINEENATGALILEENGIKFEEPVPKEAVKEEVQIILEDRNQESTQEKSETEIFHSEEHLNENRKETDEEPSTEEINDETVKKSTKKRTTKPKTNQ